MSRRHAATSTYVFRVRILGGFYAPPDGQSIWREVELAADQTLAELGEHIPVVFGFDDDHLWSFFLSGKPWDRASEYARLPDPPVGERMRGADGLRVGEAPPRKEFLFLFDYGDEWHFGVRLVRTGEVEPGARYPRVVASQGQAPPQYPDLDEEDEGGWDKDEPAELGPPPFPPVELAPLPELRAAAAAAPTVRLLQALVDWLGEGRKLTPAGNLTPVDGKELAERLGLVDPERLADLRVRSARDIPGLEPLIGWAKLVRLARVHKGQLVPVKRHRHLLDEPLALLYQAAAVLPLVDRSLPLSDVIGPSFPGGLAEALAELVSLLYWEEEPVTLAELAGHFWEEHVEAVLDEPAGRLEVWRLATVVETAQYLGLLQSLGMVEHGGSDAEPAGVVVDLDDAEEPRDPGAVLPSSLTEMPFRLTPLGTWWTNMVLRAGGEVAPVIGEPAGADAATLIEGVSGHDPIPATVPTAEMLASVLRDGGPARLVEHLERLGPPAEQVTVLADLWRARTPDAAAVLEAAGTAHPDRQVAKAARKAAFKLRSLGHP